MFVAKGWKKKIQNLINFPPSSPIVPIAETKRSLAQCRSRVEAPDKSRIQSFEFIRSIIFCRKLFLKRESYFSSAAYDVLSVIPRLLFRFFNESYEGTAEGKLCLPVFVTRFILEIFPLR